MRILFQGLEIFRELVILYYSSEGAPQTNNFLERNYYHVICTKGKRPRPRRVRDHPRARRYRRNCCYAFAGTQDRQYLQYRRQLPAVTPLVRAIKVPSFWRGFFVSKFGGFLSKSKLNTMNSEDGVREQ